MADPLERSDTQAATMMDCRYVAPSLPTIVSELSVATATQLPTGAVAQVVAV